MTSGTGFANQIEDSESSIATSLADPCKVSVLDVKWESFAEVSDYSENFTSTWKATISASSEC
jgi:hypothetical protein